MVIRNSCFLIVLIVLMGSFVGCYQRTVAPALTFDQKNAETLDNEIKKNGVGLVAESLFWANPVAQVKEMG